MDILHVLHINVIYTHTSITFLQCNNRFGIQLKWIHRQTTSKRHQNVLIMISHMCVMLMKRIISLNIEHKDFPHL